MRFIILALLSPEHILVDRCRGEVPDLLALDGVHVLESASLTRSSYEVMFC